MQITYKMAARVRRKVNTRKAQAQEVIKPLDGKPFVVMYRKTTDDCESGAIEMANGQWYEAKWVEAVGSGHTNVIYTVFLPSIPPRP